jgi:two-component system, NtrC family, response regulator HydG
MGAVDYIAKPFDHSDMVSAVQRIIADHPTERSDERVAPSIPSVSTAGIVGNCAAMRTLYEHIERMAPTDSTVLVLGETGTGKELVARSIHQNSLRAEKILISVNCAAIPDTLIESELFGYEKGAFTGANASRMGLIEAADGGTLFLDEIGELPMEAQARLLRFIQEGEIRRIGSVHSRKVNVRLICATHRNLHSLAAEGQFRQDLFYRINVLRLALPPLRDRGKDILHLAERMLRTQTERLGKPMMRLSPRAIQAITTYQWPGNVRELEHAIERAVILSNSEEIDNEALGIDLELVNINRIRGHQGPKTLHTTSAHTTHDPLEDLSLEDYFQRFVLEHQDSMSETELAQKLGVSRKCLWERRQRFGIPRNKASMNARGKITASEGK